MATKALSILLFIGWKNHRLHPPELKCFAAS